MMLGAGFMQDMVDKNRENLAKLPSKQNQKYTFGRKFMQGRTLIVNHKQNSQKIKVKEISESKLEEVISRIKLDAQKERRKRRLLIPLIILISILILIMTYLLFAKYLEWAFAQPYYEI